MDGERGREGGSEGGREKQRKCWVPLRSTFLKQKNNNQFLFFLSFPLFVFRCAVYYDGTTSESVRRLKHRRKERERERETKGALPCGASTVC